MSGLSLVMVGLLILVLILVAGVLLFYGRLGRGEHPSTTTESASTPAEFTAFVPSSNGAARAGLPVDEAGKREREALQAELKKQGTRIEQLTQEVAASRAAAHTRTSTPPASSPPPTGPSTGLQAAKARLKARAQAAAAPLVVIQTGVKAEAGAERRTLPPGWKIPFVVESKINSDIPGSFEARVSQTVYAFHDRDLKMIPVGALVQGEAQSGRLIPGNTRLPLSGVTLAIPGLKPIDLGSMPVMDQEGQTGMVDEINHHYGWLASVVILRSGLDGAMRMAQQQASSEGPAGAMGTSLLQNTQQTANQQLPAIYDVRPTINVYQGSRGYIRLTKALKLPPLPE
jgi:type IV secretion system protein VirB10